MGDIPVNITELICPDRQIHLPTLVHSSQFTAVLICLILGFLEKRQSLWPGCCSGRPGLIIPINLLDDFENRWAYAFSFGAITNTIVLIFLGGQAISETYNTAAKVSLGIVFSIEVCIAFFPFFACLVSRFKLVGSTIGFFYVGLWLAAILENTIQCIDPFPEVVSYLGLLLNLPCILCLGFLLCKFLAVGIKSVLKQNFIENKDPYKVACEFHLNHVEYMFRKNSGLYEEDDPSRCKKFYQFVLQMFFNGKQDHFKFSTRMICTIFVVLMCIYQLGTFYYYFNAWVFYTLEEQTDELVNITDIEPNSTLVESIDLSLKMLSIGWDIMNGVIFLIFCINLILILGKYRLNLQQLYKGDRTFLPREYDMTSAEILRSCMLFSGYQIAYQIWGYFIFVFVGWLIVVIISLVIVLPIVLGTWSIILWLAYIFIIPGSISLLLRYSQKLLAQLVFLQDKLEKEDEDKPLAITNRKLYHITNYFLFIANIQVGLFSSLYRILKSFVWGLLYLGRIDMCVLMPGKEQLDKGYNAYIGMLLVEHSHNNPTLRTFCQLLLDGVHKTKTAQSSTTPTIPTKYSELFDTKESPEQKSSKAIALVSVETLPHIQEDNEKQDDRVKSNGHCACNEESMEEEVKWRKAPASTYARTRWHLLFTLYSQPELIALRKHNLLNKTSIKSTFSDKILHKFKTNFLGVNNPSYNSDQQNFEIQILVNRQKEQKMKQSMKRSDKEPVENTTFSTSDSISEDPASVTSAINGEKSPPLYGATASTPTIQKRRAGSTSDKASTEDAEPEPKSETDVTFNLDTNSLHKTDGLESSNEHKISSSKVLLSPMSTATVHPENDSSFS